MTLVGLSSSSSPSSAVIVLVVSMDLVMALVVPIVLRDHASSQVVGLTGCAFAVLLAGLSFVCLALRSPVLAWRAFTGEARTTIHGLESMSG